MPIATSNSEPIKKGQHTWTSRRCVVITFKPTLDGCILREKYIDSLLQGPPNDVPLITSNNKDESGASPTVTYTVSGYLRNCKIKYGNLSETYLELYPAGNDTNTASMSWNAAARDTSVISSWAFAKG